MSNLVVRSEPVFGLPRIGDSAQGLGPADVSGGTETTDATYQYNAFTTSGTLTINTEGVADVLIVGGGGGGGGYYSGGGGGGGGVTFLEDVPLTGASMAVVVGAGGAGGSNSSGVTDRGTTGLASALGPYATPGGGGGQRLDPHRRERRDDRPSMATQQARCHGRTGGD